MKKILLSLYVITAICFISASAQKIPVSEIISKHLDSIGTAESRKAIKTMVVVGESEVRLVSQSSPKVLGRVVIASDTNKFFFGLNLNSADYPLEKISFDGNKSKIAYIRTGIRSALGNFINSNSNLLERGLMTGTLSTSWFFLQNKDESPKLSYEGIKKIDGKETYAISYPNSNGLDITLFFDKETFHHIRSEYKTILSAGIGLTPDQSSKFSEARLKVTEDFSDFKTVNNLTLPHNYRITYALRGASTSETEWNFNAFEFAFNKTLDDRTFVQNSE